MVGTSTVIFHDFQSFAQAIIQLQLVIVCLFPPTPKQKHRDTDGYQIGVFGTHTRPHAVGDTHGLQHVWATSSGSGSGAA